MPHFFINSNQIKDNKIIINDNENYHHITRSLRSRAGEKLLLIDEKQIQYETTIENITSSLIEVQIKRSYPSTRKLDFELYLAQSPLRSDAQNLLIEKATELGVKAVYPVKTDNCALNNETIDKKIAKWQKIMIEASKQCERADIPICKERTTIENLLSAEKFDKIIIFCERIACKTRPSRINKGEKVLVIIGPEGGFSQREFEEFSTTAQIEMLTLGNLILKADTAVVVGLGNLIYEYSNQN